MDLNGFEHGHADLWGQLCRVQSSLRTFSKRKRVHITARAQGFFEVEQPPTPRVLVKLRVRDRHFTEDPELAQDVGPDFNPEPLPAYLTELLEEGRQDAAEQEALGGESAFLTGVHEEYEQQAPAKVEQVADLLARQQALGKDRLDRPLRSERVDDPAFAKVLGIGRLLEEQKPKPPRPPHLIRRLKKEQRVVRPPKVFEGSIYDRAEYGRAVIREPPPPPDKEQLQLELLLDRFAPHRHRKSIPLHQRHVSERSRGKHHADPDLPIVVRSGTAVFEG